MPEFLVNLHEHFLLPERLPVAVGALLIASLSGLVTGPIAGYATPFVWWIVDNLFGRLGGRLDRRQRKKTDLFLRGAIYTLIIAVVVLGAGFYAQKIAYSYPRFGFVEMLLLTLTLCSGTVWFSLMRLYNALKNNKVMPGTYYTIARSTRTDLSGSDNFGITRAGIAFVANTFEKGIMAPLLWYLIGGLPLAFLYAGLSALSYRFGKEGFTKGFGLCPLYLEKLMGVVPSALAGIYLALAGLFTPTTQMTRAMKGWVAKTGDAPYEQGGIPVTTIAWALDIVVGGPVADLDGSAVPREWIGPDNTTSQLDSGHLRRAIYISVVAHLLVLATLLGAIVASGNFF